MVTASKEEISESIKSFLKVYFEQYFELMKNNNHKIKDLNRISYPALDGMFIFKFVRVELGHLKSLDPHILDDNLKKLYIYTEETVSELVKFKKECMSGEIVFENYFLTSNNEAKAINDEFDKEQIAKSINLSKVQRITKELKELKNTTKRDEGTVKLEKKLNSDLADTLQDIDDAKSKLEKLTIEKEDFESKYLLIFVDIYKAISQKILSQIETQINIFSFSVDRDIWKNSLKSEIIVDFFRDIGQTENMNIQQYMKFHLKNQASEDSKDEEKVKFREDLIDAIDKVKLIQYKTKKYGER